MNRAAARSGLVERRIGHMTIVVALIIWSLVSVAVASASTTGTLIISSSGLPKGQRATLQLEGRGVKRTLRLAGPRSLQVPPGHYSVMAKQVSIGDGVRGIEPGAVAYPSRKKAAATVKAGARASVVAHYGGIVNPASTALPGNILGFLGSPEEPNAVLLPPKGQAPTVGAIFVSGPTPELPHGLIAKVTAVRKEPRRYVASLEAVPVTDAVPSLEFEGSIDFRPATGATGSPDALARASSGCSPPKLLKFGAHLDSFQLRQASVDVFPPQMRLSLAIRSTESMGLAAAAAGINCNWTLAELGPFDAAIPLGPLLIPVYATLPLSAGVHINGSLNAATINVASTTVASVAAGSQNGVSLEQQGANVWTSGVLSLSGSAKLSASIGVQAGIGVSKVGNVHVNAGFGPEFEWSSGHECWVYANLGSLSAGVSVLGKTLDTPSWTPIRPRLWSGCAPGGGGSKGGGGSGGAGGGSGGAGGGPGAPGGGSPGGGPEPIEEGSGERRVMITTVSEDGTDAIAAPRGGSGEEAPGAHDPACTLDGVCVVSSGYYHSGTSHWFLNTYESGSWNQEEAPLPAGANPGVGEQLGQPACAAASACVVPGTYDQGRPMIEVLEGGTWSVVKAPAPPGTVPGELNDFASACSKVGVCVVIGKLINGASETLPMIDTYHAGSWSSVQAPVPSGGLPGTARLYEPVACAAAEECLVNGDYVGLDGETHRMIEELVSGTWSAIDVPIPAGGEPRTGDVGSPACSWQGLCVLLGGYARSGTEEPMLDRLVNGAWSSVDYSALPLDGIRWEQTTQPACSAGGTTCAVGGEYQSTTTGPDADGIVTITSTAAEATGMPQSSYDPLGYIGPGSGVSKPACLDPDDCVMIGFRHNMNGLVYSWLDYSVAGLWSSVEPPVPPGGDAGSGRLKGSPVCAAGGFCVVAGEYEAEAATEHGMVDIRDSADSWAAVGAPVPAGGARGTGRLELHEAPACAAGVCVLVGEYESLVGG